MARRPKVWPPSAANSTSPERQYVNGAITPCCCCACLPFPHTRAGYATRTAGMPTSTRVLSAVPGCANGGGHECFPDLCPKRDCLDLWPLGYTRETLWSVDLLVSHRTEDHSPGPRRSTSAVDGAIRRYLPVGSYSASDFPCCARKVRMMDDAVRARLEERTICESGATIL